MRIYNPSSPFHFLQGVKLRITARPALLCCKTWLTRHGLFNCFNCCSPWFRAWSLFLIAAHEDSIWGCAWGAKYSPEGTEHIVTGSVDDAVKTWKWYKQIYMRIMDFSREWLNYMACKVPGPLAIDGSWKFCVMDGPVPVPVNGNRTIYSKCVKYLLLNLVRA